MHYTGFTIAYCFKAKLLAVSVLHIIDCKLERASLSMSSGLKYTVQIGTAGCSLSRLPCQRPPQRSHHNASSSSSISPPQSRHLLNLAPTPRAFLALLLASFQLLIFLLLEPTLGSPFWFKALPNPAIVLHLFALPSSRPIHQVNACSLFRCDDRLLRHQDQTIRRTAHGEPSLLHLQSLNRPTSQ